MSCQPPFIEPLILLYRGTTSEVDRRVLHMLQLFEGYRKISIASVMRYWNASGVLGIGGKSLDALTSLDPQKTFATCQSYPLHRKLRGWGKIATDPEEGEELYDPVFVMGLFIASMHEGMRGLDWVEVLRSNVLGLTVCGLSSRDREVRNVASYALAKTMSLIEVSASCIRKQGVVNEVHRPLVFLNERNSYTPFDFFDMLFLRQHLVYQYSLHSFSLTPFAPLRTLLISFILCLLVSYYKDLSSTAKTPHCFMECFTPTEKGGRGKEVGWLDS